MLQSPIPAHPAIDCFQIPARIDHLIFRFDEKAVLAMAEELGYGSAWAGDHRRPTSQRFDKNQPERLLPVNRNQQAGRIGQEGGFLPVSLLSQPLDQRMPEQRAYFVLEEALVGWIDSGGDRTASTAC